MMVSVATADRVNQLGFSEFCDFECFAEARNPLIYSVSGPSEDQNIVFLKGRPANAARDSVCEGSSDQEPDRARKSMDRGGGERPGAEKHGFDSPCTAFGHFCWSESS